MIAKLWSAFAWYYRRWEASEDRFQSFAERRDLPFKRFLIEAYSSLWTSFGPFVFSLLSYRLGMEFFDPPISAQAWAIFCVLGVISYLGVVGTVVYLARRKSHRE